MYTLRVTPEGPPGEPLDSSHHRWDAVKHRLSSGIGVDLDERGQLTPPSPDEWFIQVHWRLIEGRPMPVGIDVRSYREPVQRDREGTGWFDTTDTRMHRGPRPGDNPKPVTRELFKHLMIGELIEQGLDQIATVHDYLTDRFADRFEAADTEERRQVSEALHRQPERRSPSDAKYRRTAETSAEERQHRNRSLRSWRRLVDEGVTTREGDPPTAELVRKWIAEARRRGYLPPAEPRGDASAKTGN